jgi:hypothetical protein
MTILIILIVLLSVIGLIYSNAVSDIKDVLKKNGFSTPFYTELKDYKNLWFLAKQEPKYKPLAVIFISSTIILILLLILIIIIVFFTNIVE